MREAIMVLIITSTTIFAKTQTVKLDSSFGSDGLTKIDFANSSDLALCADFNSDGNIVILGNATDSAGVNIGVALIASDGTPIDSFGTNGKVMFSFPSNVNVSDMVLTFDDIIYTVGSSQQSSSHSFLSKIKPNGTLDLSFGNNSGYTSINFSNNHEALLAVDVQDDGKIVATGSNYVTASKSDIFVVRFNADGSLDSTFNNSGFQLMDIDDSHEFGNDIKVLEDDKILIGAGSSGGSHGEAFVLVKLNSDGTIDSLFGDNGTVLTTGIGGNNFKDMILEPNGAITLVGIQYKGDRNIGMARILPDGNPDLSFGVDGKKSVHLGGNEFPETVIRVSDGSYLVAGSGILPAYGFNSTTAFITRILSNGFLDSSFTGNPGSVGYIQLPSANSAYNELLMFPGDKFLAIGNGGNDPVTKSDFIISRYEYDLSTGLKKYPENKKYLSISPNPTSGLFTLRINDSSDEVRIKIYDLNGRLIQAGNFPNAENVNLNLVDQNSGVYLLEIQTNEDFPTYIKLIKR